MCIRSVLLSLYQGCLSIQASDDEIKSFLISSGIDFHILLVCSTVYLYVLYIQTCLSSQRTSMLYYCTYVLYTAHIDGYIIQYDNTIVGTTKE